MAKSIYKYVSNEYLAEIIGKDSQISLKCSLPKNFNDPYELFLTIDFAQEPDALAFYVDVVGDLPQLPTTCFSRSPAAIPLWAHYANNLQGVAVEFDEKMLGNMIEDSRCQDITYRDCADDHLNEMLYRAFILGKPRHIYQLQAGIFNAVYFTKLTCWSYENESRLVAALDQTRTVSGTLLLDVPCECVTALICGPRASASTKRELRVNAKQLGCKYYEMKIGRTSPLPIFLNAEGIACAFDGSAIRPCPHCCASCKEPTDGNQPLCPWCRIDESHRQEAANRNTYRMLDHYGLLQKYIADMNKINQEFKDKSEP